MWFFWYFLIILALGLSALGMVLSSNWLDSKIKAGNFRAALLNAVLVTAIALFLWACVLLTPFNLASFRHWWWDYLAALLVLPGTVGAWRTARRLFLMTRHEPPAKDAPGTP